MGKEERMVGEEREIQNYFNNELIKYTKFIKDFKDNPLVLLLKSV
jgi:hypothetical protein